jgi:hypothetical protein
MQAFSHPFKVLAFSASAFFFLFAGAVLYLHSAAGREKKGDSGLYFKSLGTWHCSNGCQQRMPGADDVRLGTCLTVLRAA